MLSSLPATFSQLELRDIFDILVISLLIYGALTLIRGTRAWHMTVGVLSLVVVYYVTQLLHLRTVEWVLANFFAYVIFALIVIFQSEIRRGLAELGKGRLFGRFRERRRREDFEEIVVAATTLAKRKIGGLIVLEGAIGLKNYIENGIQVDASLTYDLLVTVFTPGTPLHDGAVIIQGDRIAAAACFLPLTLDPLLSKELGTRHRAAIGITEETDAIAIVISEETGFISAVFEGQMSRQLSGEQLLDYLNTTSDRQNRGFFRRFSRETGTEPRQEVT